jgi:glycosyltransferase involved in cell wall biosynthesis
MTRILFLQHGAEIGGAELHLCSVASAWRESSTALLFRDGPLHSALRAEGVPTQVAVSSWASRGVRLGVPTASARDLLSVGRLVAVAARAARRADVIYANSPKALIVAECTRRIVPRPVLWYLHDIFDRSHFSAQAIRQMVARANRAADCILANSVATAQAFRSAGGRDTRLQVVPNGIDATRFCDSPDDRQPVRQELGIGKGPLVGVFGRVTRWKGQHVVVEALSGVPGVAALIVGPETEDPAYAQQLRQLTNECGLGARVRFLGFRDDVSRLMRACDLVVHAPVAPEPFGRVLVEAMLTNRPIVASAAGGAAEIIEDGVTGVLVPAGDPGRLAAAIAGLVGDPARSAALARQGQRRALERFTEARMHTAMRDHIEALAQRRGREAPQRRSGDLG